MNRTERLLVAALILGSSVPMAFAGLVPEDTGTRLMDALRGDVPFAAPSPELLALPGLAQAVSERLVKLDSGLKDVDSLTPEQVKEIKARFDSTKLEELRRLILIHKSLSASTPEASSPFAPGAAPSATPNAARETLTRDMSRSVSMTSLQAGAELSFDGAGARDAVGAGQAPPPNSGGERLAIIVGEDAFVGAPDGRRGVELLGPTANVVPRGPEAAGRFSVPGPVKAVGRTLGAVLSAVPEGIGAAYEGFSGSAALLTGTAMRILGWGVEKGGESVHGAGAWAGFNRLAAAGDWIKDKGLVTREAGSLTAGDGASLTAGSAVRGFNALASPFTAPFSDKLPLDPTKGKLARAGAFVVDLLTDEKFKDREPDYAALTFEQAYSLEALTDTRIRQGAAWGGGWGFYTTAAALGQSAGEKFVQAVGTVLLLRQLPASKVLTGLSVGSLLYGSAEQAAHHSAAIASAKTPEEKTLAENRALKASLDLLATLLGARIGSKYGAGDLEVKGAAPSRPGAPAPHEVLGVAAKASEAEIRAAWYSLVRRYFHDMNRGDSNAMEMMKSINNAKTSMMNKIHADAAGAPGRGFADAPRRTDTGVKPAPGASSPAAGAPTPPDSHVPAVVGGQAVLAPPRTPGAPFGGREYIPVERPEVVKEVVEALFAGRSTRLAVAGYLKPPSPERAAQTRKTIDGLIVEMVPEELAMTNSTVLSEGSVDAILTAAAQKYDVKMGYFTAKKYLDRKQMGPVEPGIDMDLFRSVPKLVLESTDEYSDSCADSTGALFVEGGRDATIGDFVDAIKKGNRVAIHRNVDSSEPAWDPSKGMSEYTSAYLGDQLRFLKSGVLPHPATRGLDERFLTEHRQDIERLVKVFEVNDINYASPAILKAVAAHLKGSGGGEVQGRSSVETRDAGVWERLRSFVTGTPTLEGRAPAEFGPEAEASVGRLRAETRAALEAKKGRLLRYLRVLRPGADAGAAYEKLLASADSMDIRLAERGELRAKASHVREKSSGREYVVFRTDVLGSSPEVRRAVLAHELLHSAGFGEFTTHRVEAMLGGRGDPASSDPHQVDQARLHKAMREGELAGQVIKGYGARKLAADAEPETLLRLSKESLKRARATETPADRRAAQERVDEQRRAMGLRIPQDAAIVKEFERRKERLALTDADLVEGVDLGRRVRAAGLPGKPFVDRLFYDAVDVKALPDYGIKLRVGDGGDAAARAKIMDAFLEAAKAAGEPVDFKVALFMKGMTGIQAGKFVTIYTRNPGLAMALAGSLDAKMEGEGLRGTSPAEDFAFGRSGLVSWAAAGYKSREFAVPDGRGGSKMLRDDPARRPEILDAMAHLPGMEPWVALAEGTPQMARHREWARGLEAAGREPAAKAPTAEQLRWYKEYDARGQEDTLDVPWKGAVVRYMAENPDFKP